MDTPNIPSSWIVGGIPEGIPTGVWSSSGLSSSEVASKSEQVSVTQTSWAPTYFQQFSHQDTSWSSSVVPSPQQPSSVISTSWTSEGVLDNFFHRLIRFIAKITGQPDPLTWVSNTSPTSQTTQRVVGKVWDTANQALQKVSTITSQATQIVEKATEKIQEVIPPPASVASSDSSQPSQTQPSPEQSFNDSTQPMSSVS